MISFNIPYEAFERIAKVCTTPDDEHYKFPFSRGVRVARAVAGGKFVTTLTATNGKILVCEVVEQTDMPTGALGSVVVDPTTLLKRQAGEHIISSDADVFLIDDAFVDVEQYLPRDPVDNLGTKFVNSFDITHMNLMASTTRTGKLIFPDRYNLHAKETIVVNEYQNDDWFGLFLPLAYKEKVQPTAASVPTWM